MKKILSLIIAIMLFFSFVLVGCSSKTPAINETQKPAATQTSEATKAAEATNAPEATTIILEYKESPFFAGKGLPPVKDRLPKEPKIVNEMPEDLMTSEIGTYGGTLRVVTAQVDFDGNVFCGANEALLNTPGILGTEITGNVLKGYEVTPDQKEYTFHMREGLKWSDGTPVTAKDVQFTIDDFLFNKELTPIFPGWLCSGGDATGTPLKFTMVDDFTFKFAFDKPYGGLAIRMAIQGWRGYTELLKPAAYLKKFHKKYNKDTVALEAEIKAAKFKPGEWVNLFNDKDILNWELSGSKSIGFPRLYPWLCTKKAENVLEFERNPYYFKVDKAGNQLPYIDKIRSTYVADGEMVTMKNISGEVDFGSGTMNNMPLYKDNEAKGGYKVLLLNNHVTPTDIFLNQTFKNDNWRKVVRDERFRKALHLGINSKEIIDTIYFGFAEPSTVTDTIFDVAAANKLLDEMGMTKGTDGFRKGPDGKKFTIPFEVQDAGNATDIIPLSQLLVEQWKALGLDVTMKKIDGTLWGTRNSANELQATIIYTHTPLWYMGDWGQDYWGPLWNNYFNTAGKQGEKPPADVQKLYDLVTKVSTDKPQDAIAAVDAVKAEIKTHNWYFIPLSNAKIAYISNVKLKNVSEKGFGIAVLFSMEQFFFKK